MAEDNVQANIRIGIDTSDALVSIKNLQRQISAFHNSMANGSAANAASAANFQKTLIDNVNATKKFSASVQTVKTTTETFTNSLEKNKLSLGQYFRYAGGASKSFGRLFATEFDTINKVARERVKDLQTQYIKMGRDANGAMKAIAVRPLVLDMDNLATKTAIAAQRQQLLNQLLKQGSTNLLNFGKNTQWAGRQLMVGFTIPLSIFGSTAAKSFMAIEDQAIKFKRVYGDLMTDSGQTDAMLESIKTLASEFTKYGIAVDKTMGLAASAAAQGKMGADLTAQVAEATRLSVLGQVEQQQALETTISVTNAFGVAAEDLASKIDFLNAVENQTVTSIEDLTIAIPKAGPVVKQLGGDVEDLAFFLTAMKEGGINASEGANALKSGLASLINPTEKASGMLAGFGININKIVESNKGDVKGIVIDFASALDKLDPLKRARAIEQLFGKFQFSRLSTLFQNVIGEGTQAQKVLELAATSSEGLAALSERELGKISESSMFKFKKSIEDIKVALAPIGETFLKLATPVIEFGTKILNSFNALDERTKNFVAGLVAVVGGIGPILLMTFGLLANGIANIIKGFTFVKNVFNRASVSSNDLGSQISYMTSEQLKAAGVAASLDQVHGKLTQTFTAEASAIGAYVSALQRANTAAAAFNVPAVGRSRPVAKMSTGGFVSGSGNGDTIPAMLTPGEFVVKKKSAEKVMPLLEAINSGKIAGFARGGRAGSGPSGRAGKSKATLPINYKANVSNQSGAIDFSSILPDQQSLAYLYSDQILKNSGTSAAAVSKQIMLWERANVDAINAATEAVQSGVPATEAFSQLADKFNKDMLSAEGPVKQFTDSAKKMMPQLAADFNQAQQAAKELKLNLRSAADTAKLADVLPDNMLAQSMNTPGNYQGLSRTRGAAASIFGEGSKNFKSTGVPSFMMSKGLDTKSVAYGNMMTQEHIAVTKQQEANREAMLKIRAEKDSKVIIKKMSEVLGKEENDPLMLQRSQQRNSPHPQAGIDGTDDAKARIAAEQKVFKRESRRVQGISTGNGGMSIVPVLPSQSQQIADAPQARVSRRVTRPADLDVRQAQAQVDLIDSVDGSTKANKENSKVVGRFGSAATNAILGVTSVGFALSSVPGPIGEFASRMSALSGVLYGLSFVTEMLTKQKILETIVTRKNNAIAATRSAFGVADGTGLFAKGGGGLFKNIATNFSKFSMFFKNFVGISLRLAGVIGLVAGGLLLLNDAIQKQIKKQNEFADALKIPQKQTEAVASFFGVSGKDAKIDSAGTQLVVAPEQRAEIKSFANSEEAKGYGAQIDALKSPDINASQATAILGGVSVNLQAQGVGKEQIDSVLAYLQEQANRTELKLSFKNFDITTKEGTTGLQKRVASLATKFAATYEKGMEEVTINVGGKGGGRSVTTKRPSLSKEGKSAAKATKELVDGTNQALGDLEIAFSGGLMSSKEFKNEMIAIGNTLKNIGGSAAFDEIFKSMENNPTAQMAIGLKDTNDQMMVLQALQLGLGPQMEVHLNALKSQGTSYDEIIAKARARAEIEAIIAGNLEAVQAALDAAKGSAEDFSGGGTKIQSAFEKAMEQVKGNTTELLNQVKAFNKLKSAGYGTEKAFELAKDPILAAALASTKVGSKEWKTLTAEIRKTEAAAKSAKNALSQTMAGATEDFERAYGNVTESFSALEENLQLAFDKANKADLDLVSSSESQIADLAYSIDDYNATLDDIQLQEDAINERYDKRVDALDKVQTINEEITRQQKSQLTIADALSQGDIAAAARAIQDAKSEDAQARLDAQRTALESSRDAEINGVRVGGQSRVDVEKKILSLQSQIKKIEEESLEPAQNRIRLAEEKLQKDISSLTIAGKTKDEWTLIANNIRIAKTETKEFVDLLMSAYAAAQGLSAILKTNKAIPMVDANITPAQYAAVVASAKLESANPNLGGSGIAGANTRRLLRMSSGGMVPKYFAAGGFARGTDTVPSMLTPGEFVVSKYAVKDFGVNNLKSINNGSYDSGSVYNNYELNVNVRSDANANDIARTVIAQIKQIDSQRLRGNRL